MKDSGSSILLTIAVAALILFAFNFPGSQKLVPLSQVFPLEGEELESLPDGHDFVGRNQVVPLARPVPELKLPAAQPAAPRPAEKSKKVAVIKIPPITTPPATRPRVSVPVAAGPTGAFTIQVVSHKDKSGADEAASALKSAGFPVFLTSRNLGDKGLWYRIYVGNFSTKAEADAYLPQIQAKYPASFVITRP